MGKGIEQIRDEALNAIETASSEEKIQDLSVRFLGRKGLVTLFLRNISSLPPKQRADAGKQGNKVKKALEKAVQNTLERIQTVSATFEDSIDVSLPGRASPLGHLHPITQINQRICDIFVNLGFDVVEGPEIETDYYNFEALNIPKNHPARDMQDTFYIDENVVLRTHTSPVQIRVMEQQTPPVRIVAPGKVYRCDSDLTHTPMFHQVEGLLVGEGISFGDLKGILTAFVHQMFDDQTSLRFRPSFFPFTEPSAEVDILCVMCRGKGCRVCSRTGWIEVLGSGMVHPALFENVGYDTERYTGFAFGVGIERFAMLRYGIEDMRLLYSGDMRMLAQF